MKDDKQNVEELNQVISAGMSWLQKYGIIAPVAHNNIVLNLYVAFPKVRYLEYFLPEQSDRRKVWVVLYVPFWKLLFTNRDRMIDEVIDFLREYLDGYDIQVDLKRYKKGVEKSNEIPTKVVSHLHDAPANPDPASGTPPEDAPSAPDQPVNPQAGSGTPAEGS